MCICVMKVASGFIKAIKDGGMLELRSLLCIGGVDVRLQCDEIRKGIHIAVSTPGRLKVSGNGPHVVSATVSIESIHFS